MSKAPGRIDRHGNCPACGMSWDGGPIPEENHKHYSPPYRWSKLIGVDYKDKYDGVSEWMCPFCKTRWDRWSGKVVGGSI